MPVENSYSNYLGKNTNIKTITITSMKRTPHDQAFLVYLDSIDHPNGIGSMYAHGIGELARKCIVEGKAHNLHKPDTSKRDTSNGTNPHYHLTVN